MFQNSRVFVFLYFGAFVLLFLSGCVYKKPAEIAPPVVMINHQSFTVEVARTPTEQALGLAERDSLADDSGMLFVFSEKQPRFFWMKGMRFPLDIIWIKDNLVADCERYVPILSIGRITEVASPAPVNYVLEVKAGTCDKYKIKAGDRVDINIK